MGAIDFPGEVYFGFAHVHDAELDGMANLLGGEADALGIVHGVDHFVGEFPQGGVKNRNFCTFLTEYR